MKEDARYFDVYADLLYDPGFMEMPITAQLIYVDMGIESSKNIDDFTFPYELYKGRYSKTTFAKAIKELEKHGFIKVKRFKGKESHYALSANWQHYTREN